jgi:hypothetical protein
LTLKANAAANALQDMEVDKNDDDVNILKVNLKAIPSPSTFARPNSLIDWELKANNPIFCHRPRFATISVSAKFGVFSQFLQDLHHIEVNQLDIGFVLKCA